MQKLIRRREKSRQNNKWKLKEKGERKQVCEQQNNRKADEMNKMKNKRDKRNLIV